MKFLAWVLSPALIALTSFVGPASSPGPLASGVGKVGTFLLATAPYAGPTPDEALDASDQALRVAQEAAEAENARLAQEAAQRAPSATQRPVAPAIVPVPPSGDWFYRIAVCETGQNPPQNGWRTGYFGIEAGYPIGHLTWDEQLAWAQDILAKYGATAWGCVWTVGFP